MGSPRRARVSTGTQGRRVDGGGWCGRGRDGRARRLAPRRGSRREGQGVCRACGRRRLEARRPTASWHGSRLAELTPSGASGTRLDRGVSVQAHREQRGRSRRRCARWPDGCPNGADLEDRCGVGRRKVAEPRGREETCNAVVRGQAHVRGRCEGLRRHAAARAARAVGRRSVTGSSPVHAGSHAAGASVRSRQRRARCSSTDRAAAWAAVGAAADIGRHGLGGSEDERQDERKRPSHATNLSRAVVTARHGSSPTHANGSPRDAQRLGRRRLPTGSASCTMAEAQRMPWFLREVCISGLMHAACRGARAT